MKTVSNTGNSYDAAKIAAKLAKPKIKETQRTNPLTKTAPQALHKAEKPKLKVKLESNWQLKNEAAPPQRLFELCEAVSKNKKEASLLTRILFNRDISDPNLIKNYYLKTEKLIQTEALAIPEMDKAYKRIQNAINQNEKILIYGDYDVDGTTSVALLTRAFKMIGVDVNHYIPNRHEEGYGLNNQAIEKIKKEKYRSHD